MGCSIRLIGPEEFPVSRWAGGSTTQLVIRPQEAEYAGRSFLWRLSTATVELEESTFTPLPDYLRAISVIEGEMTLVHNNGQPIRLAPYELTTFDGCWETVSRGKCVDFNLMTRKGRCNGGMEPLRLAPGSELSLSRPGCFGVFPTITHALYCAEGDIELEWEGKTYPLGQRAMALIELEDHPKGVRLTLRCKGEKPAGLMLASVRC